MSQDFEPANRASTVGAAQFYTALGFALLCLGFHAFSEQGWVPLLDSANLALHEAGHPLVGLFNDRATVYGGTLFQLAFPAAAIWHFHRLDHATGVAMGYIWLGENLLNIARYMADARTQELPLVGNGDHDWTEIFSRWHVLAADTRLAGMTRGVAVILIAWALLRLYRRWQSDQSS